jgi:hypothetical protein
MHEIASTRVRYDFARIFVLIRREGLAGHTSKLIGSTGRKA